jgi:hypothetical protein
MYATTGTLTVLSRDPFARGNFVRERAHTGSCDWCGQVKQLYRYGFDPDGAADTPYLNPHRFCSVGCYRDFAS